MTRVHAAFALAFAVAVAIASAPQNRQRPTFRAGTDVVTLTAFVRQGNLTVPGLTGPDFIVTDNGVRQTVTAIPGEAVPFDLTIVLDLSGSVEGMLDQLKRQVREVAALLRPDDRLRLVTFSDKIVDIFGFLPGDADLPLDDLARRPADAALRRDGDVVDAHAAGGSRTGRRAPDRRVRHRRVPTASPRCATSRCDPRTCFTCSSSTSDPGVAARAARASRHAAVLVARRT